MIYICSNYIYRKLIKEEDCVKMFMVLVINVYKKRPSMLRADCSIANTMRGNGLDEVTPGDKQGRASDSGLRLVNPRNPEERISLQGEASILRVPCLTE